MFDYLQKFNTLPQNLRESVSSPAAMTVISELESKYKIDLAATVMKVMVKNIQLADLSIYFVSDFSLDQESAKKLTAELKERLFFPVANYLGYNASYSSVLPKTVLAPTPNPIFTAADKVVKESGVSFASLDLSARFRTIISTYLKGIRNRVDTRLTLNKEIISGGLGLDHKVIDKIFKLCDETLAGQMLPSGAMSFLPSGASLSLPSGADTNKSGLDKVRELYEKPGSARDIPYDLKTAIVKGEVKKPVTPFNLPVPEEAKEKLLAEPKKEIKPALIFPTPIKIVEPIKIPEIKINISLPAIPIIPVAPLVNLIKIPQAKLLDSIKPPASAFIMTPKINQPPVKKPGIFSKLFGTKKTVVHAPIIEPKFLPVVKAPVVHSGVAALRTQASVSQIKPVVKEVAHQVINSDLRTAPKVMGPLEELRYLDIVNFRRFGASPVEATAKVESKIKLLEKDGYDKMVSGVTAWRESPVNFLYLKMGQEALSGGLSFKQYTANCQAKGTNVFLFWEEIEAIIALNGRLMF